MHQSVFDLEITDPHHHLWDLKAHYYPWLTDSFKARVCGEYSAIRKDYLLKQFQADIGKLNVTRSVHIEAVIDPAHIVDETAWLQSIADTDESGLPHGIVAKVDFSDPNVAATLEQHAQHANLRGIRDFVHEGWIDPDHPKPTRLEDPAWRKAVGLCKKHNLHFELQIYYQQIEEALELLKEHDDLPMVLTHTGCPALQTEDHIRGWQSSIQRLAECPNLHVKLSGFGMFDRNWSARSIRPFISGCLDAFGLKRCMFASNFPVDSLACNYLDLWSRFFEVTKDLSNDERDRLFSENANRFYRIP